MVFYEIELLSIPKIRFAWSVSVEKHSNYFDYRKGFLELGIIEQGRIRHISFDGVSEIVCPGMLSPIVDDIGCVTESFKGEKQKHTTVGVKVLYNAKRYISANEYNIEHLKEKIKNGNVILVPYLWKIDEIYDKSLHIIKEISRLKVSSNPADAVEAVGKWFSLVSLITDYVMRRLEGTSVNITPSEQCYAHKAAQYIEKNYTKKITVSSVAAHLGISEGHTHRIFKKVYSMGILEYANCHRINVASALMRDYGLTLKEAALNVGVEDPAYMSRLFKKVTGSNARDFNSGSGGVELRSNTKR